ncbi:MAG: hypothetical protein B7Y88_12765 [Sphingomonadales bacterium 32-64-17]|nr:MAG: hypothetical protein B7Y88_12765 [Sphingomonadales bacterium 32-64-17]
MIAHKVAPICSIRNTREVISRRGFGGLLARGGDDLDHTNTPLAKPILIACEYERPINQGRSNFIDI